MVWGSMAYFLRPLIEGKEAIEITCIYEGDRLTGYEPGEMK